ncbi:hypothetical protein HPP92_011901 [Vanilla planifolia]|uniref:Uncharacterized protein n=1 Tax=Vanilla planifolia TaxID=51239 RepID=A0A835V167_VANPL|nr:hypothetical protein HPP92_011901 [Vanilla planifolia]
MLRKFFFSRRVSDSSLSKSVSSVSDVEIQLKGVRCLASLAAFLRYRGGYPSIASEAAGDGSTKTSNDLSSDLTIPEGVVEGMTPELQAMERVSSGNEAEWRSDAVDGSDGRRLVLLEPLDREGVLGTR